MLDEKTRTAILRLHEQGHGTRAIKRALKVSRGAVRSVLRLGSAAVPTLERAEKAEPHLDEIRELHQLCKGNLVRVHEKLEDAGIRLSYPALTASCRRHGIGYEPKPPVGHYHFTPGQEMQHDTSPHDVQIGGKLRRVQTASLVFCYSRMRFIQLYPSFTRFTCKVFLTEALRYFEGSCAHCMIDNTHVVVLHGTGAEMVPVPEMECFGDRFDFSFRAHEKGDANRSAHVERGFDHAENNFIPGREFTDWVDLNRQARAWCDKTNATFRRHLHASPRDLFAIEHPHLRPLPIWIPEPYLLHQRIVDSEGFINLHRNRYSVPYALIGRRMEVRESMDLIEVFDGPRIVASHRRVIDPENVRVIVPEHRPPRGQGAAVRPPAEEQELLAAAPEISEYVTALKKRASGRGTTALRRLLALVRDYPREPLVAAVRSATHYGLYNLDRLERIVLRNIAHDYFIVPLESRPERDDPEDADD